jgi:lipid-binding SYLF domain-containing protein
MKYSFARTAFAAVAALALACNLAARADEKSDAEQAVANFKQADAGLAKLFDNAIGYAVFPSVGEGGFIIGAEHGKGLLFEKGKIMGKVSLTAVSVGAQVGGGSFSQMIFFENASALKRFKESKYEMDAAVKASLAASGAAASAKCVQGVAVFTLPKSGAMAQAAVGGQKFKFEPVK